MLIKVVVIVLCLTIIFVNEYFRNKNNSRKTTSKGEMCKSILPLVLGVLASFSLSILPDIIMGERYGGITESEVQFLYENAVQYIDDGNYNDSKRVAEQLVEEAQKNGGEELFGCS